MRSIVLSNVFPFRVVIGIDFIILFIFHTILLPNYIIHYINIILL